MKFLEKQAAAVTINGARYVRYSSGSVDGALLLHETCVDEVRAIDGLIANAKAPAAEWQVIYSSGTVMTCRMLVPGGWLVKHTSSDRATMAYVPDLKHQWKTKIDRTV